MIQPPQLKLSCFCYRKYSLVDPQEELQKLFFRVLKIAEASCLQPMRIVVLLRDGAERLDAVDRGGELVR